MNEKEYNKRREFEAKNDVYSHTRQRLPWAAGSKLFEVIDVLGIGQADFETRESVLAHNFGNKSEQEQQAKYKEICNKKFTKFGNDRGF